MRRSSPRKRKATGPARITGELLLDVCGVAELLGLSEKAVRARVARQQLPHRRMGTGRIVFMRGEIEQFLLRLEGVSVDQALQNVEASR